jgi:ATP-dependent DNA helicase RecG
MISESQLLALLTDIATSQVERTVSIGNTDKFCQAVCAFSNDFDRSGKPGYLLVGVDDSGRPSGQKFTDQMLRDLAGIRSDGNIQPLPAISIQRFCLEGGEVAVVETLPSPLPPVRYRGKVWIRIGARRAVATEHEESVLIQRRISAALTFDALPNLEASLSDLSDARFQLAYRKDAVSEEVIAENHRSLRHQLASLRLFDLKSDCPTNAGVLVLADRPMHFLPGAYVQFVRYAGLDEASDVIAEKRAIGDLRSLLQTLDLLTEVNIRSWPVEVSPLREMMRFDYPKVALREFLVNAVMHRNYQSTAPIRWLWFSNHIRIASPGGLWGEARAENFPSQVAYRNPVLAEAIRTMGFANRFGMGVSRAMRALELNGNPPARFAFDPGGVDVFLEPSTHQTDASESENHGSSR